jgi:hypothetical protein
MKENTSGTTGERRVVREGERHRFNEDGSVTVVSDNEGEE